MEAMAQDFISMVVEGAQMKDCLHCVLRAAAMEWMKGHERASEEEVIDMLGTFVSQFLKTIRPDLSKASIMIMGLDFSDAPSSGQHKLH